MTKEILEYIRSHEYIYNFLREDSSQYQYLFQNNEYIKTIKNLAKERYKLRLVDRLSNLEEKMKLINSLIDVIK